MIDWYMLLLAPLVALPIVLLFAFVGFPCAEGSSPDNDASLIDWGSNRTLELSYTIPKKNPLLTGMEVTFMVTGQQPPITKSKIFTWASTTESSESFPVPPVKFIMGKAPVDCTCTILLKKIGGSDEKVGPKTVPSTTAAAIKFKLSYSELSPNPDYIWTNFSLNGGPKI
jgi:hypothetical protein